MQGKSKLQKLLRKKLVDVVMIANSKTKLEDEAQEKRTRNRYTKQ